MTEQNCDDRLFLSHIQDAISIASSRDISKFVGFIDERQRAVVTQYIARQKIDNYSFWGGYEGAKRVFFCALSSYAENDDYSIFPIVPITFTYRKSDTLSHRDFLGSLMALNIKREVVGDILVGEGVAVVFLSSAIAPMVLSEIKKIGKVGVKLTEGVPEVLPIREEFEEISGTVSSLRLDCVVGFITNLSREKSANLIKLKKVSINHFECDSVSKLVTQGDIISIRGVGRFVFSAVLGVTKKERLKITVLKYK